TNDGLEDEGSDGLWAFELDDFLDHRERCFGGFPSAFDTVIRIKNADDARNTRLSGPSAGISCQADGAGGGAMIGTVARHDLVAPGKGTGDLNRVLVGFGAAVSKEKRVNIAGSDFSELRSQTSARLGRHEGVCIGEGL